MTDYSGQTCVIKLGGSTLDTPAAYQNIIQQIAQLDQAGLRVLLVHGGGKRINRALTAAGIEPQFHLGQRVTDEATMAVVSRVLAQEINSQLAQDLAAQGLTLIHGDDTRILYSKPYTGDDVASTSNSPATSPWGRVGKVAKVKDLPSDGLAVIAPVGVDINSSPDEPLEYNINADWAAADIAVHYQADYLIYISDQDGILDKEQQIINHIPRAEIAGLISDEVITTGMIPKALSMAEALDRGVKKIFLVNGLVPDTLVQALAGEPCGTQIS